MRRAALIALTAVPLASSAGLAQTPTLAPPTDAQAVVIQQQIRDWVTQTLGPDIKLSKQLITVKAAGDHYDLTMPLGDDADAPMVTGTAKPRAGGQWSVENITVPTPATFHIDLPTTPGATTAAQLPSRLAYELKIGEQSGQMMIDPSFATANTSTGTMRDLEIRSLTAPLEQNTHVDRATTSLTGDPAGPDRLNINMQSSMEGYKLTTIIPQEQEPLVVGMAQMNFTAKADKVSREKLGELLQTFAKLRSMLPAPGSTPTDEQTASMKALLAALVPTITNLTSGMSFDERIGTLTVAKGDMAGALGNLQVGMDAHAADGLMQADMTFAAETLTLPDLGLGDTAELIPTKLMLHPTLAGVPTEALARLLQKAADAGGPEPDQIMALFARGPVTAGLDAFEIDMAGSKMLAQAKVTIASPADISGTGQVSISDIDQLQQRIAADPQAALVGPAIIFIKGVGRAEPGRMVWDVVFRGGHLLVNNQDLTAMLGAAGGAPADPAPSPGLPPSPGLRTPSTPPAVQQGHRDLRRKP